MSTLADILKSTSGTSYQRNVQELDYVSQRLSPRPRQNAYLHLSDLLLAMKTMADNRHLKILDYGADLSPYRSLFPNSDYRRADVGGPGAKDYLIGCDGKVGERSEVFDLILSTQVAEHLPDPLTYFVECFRLLKAGGRLFVSTHGSFEDHPFPGDFQRWTAEGLKRDLTKAGFEILAAYKMTTGPRAALHHLERCLETTFRSRRTGIGLTIWLMRTLHRASRSLINRIADKVLSDYGLVFADVASNDSAHNMYIGLAITARRPNI